MKCNYCQDTGTIHVDAGCLQSGDLVSEHYDDGSSDVLCSCQSGSTKSWNTKYIAVKPQAVKND